MKIPTGKRRRAAGTPYDRPPQTAADDHPAAGSRLQARLRTRPQLQPLDFTGVRKGQTAELSTSACAESDPGFSTPPGLRRASTLPVAEEESRKDPNNTTTPAAASPYTTEAPVGESGEDDVIITADTGEMCAGGTPDEQLEEEATEDDMVTSSLPEHGPGTDSSEVSASSGSRKSYSVTDTVLSTVSNFFRKISKPNWMGNVSKDSQQSTVPDIANENDNAFSVGLGEMRLQRRDASTSMSGTPRLSLSEHCISTDAVSTFTDMDIDETNTPSIEIPRLVDTVSKDSPKSEPVIENENDHDQDQERLQETDVSPHTSGISRHSSLRSYSDVNDTGSPVDMDTEETNTPFMNKTSSGLDQSADSESVSHTLRRQEPQTNGITKDLPTMTTTSMSKTSSTSHGSSARQQSVHELKDASTCGGTRSCDTSPQDNIKPTDVRTRQGDKLKAKRKLKGDTVLKREMLPDSHLCKGKLKCLNWTRWTQAIVPEMTNANMKSKFAKCTNYPGFRVKSIFGGDSRTPAVYEFAVQGPGSKSRKKYVVYFRKSIGYDTVMFWDLYQFRHKTIQREVERAVSRGCSIWIRRGVVGGRSRVTSQQKHVMKAGLLIKTSIDYAWKKYLWRKGEDARMFHRAVTIRRRGGGGFPIAWRDL